MSFASHYEVCEGREIHYTEWGAGRRETVVAWHGLARTGRDMDDVAEYLAERYRVICHDIWAVTRSRSGGRLGKRGRRSLA